MTVVNYSVRALFEDFRYELQKYPLILNKKFPERYRRYNDKLLSLFWDGTKNYIKSTKVKIKTRNIRIPEEDISLLEQRVNKNYNSRASKCIELINNYKLKKISGLEFLEFLKVELGTISNQIPVTNQELSLILTSSLEYVRKVLKRIRLESDADYNPNYTISKSKLCLFEEKFEDLLGSRANKLKDFVKKYIRANPNIKDYPNQQFSITNPKFFSNLDEESLTELKIPPFYWLGFLWADGRYDEEWDKIIFKLQARDFEIVERFADAVGFDIERIKYGYELKDVSRNGEIVQYDYVRVKFGCKPMAESLIKYGLIDFKKGRIGLPQLVIRTLIVARKRALKLNTKWYQTIEGKCALSFLLGFYDGDGHLMGGKYGLLHNTNKLFLDEVNILFRIYNRVSVRHIPKISEITGIFNRTGYSLNIGIKTFRMMLDAQNDSMERKRPNIT